MGEESSRKLNPTFRDRGSAFFLLISSFFLSTNSIFFLSALRALQLEHHISDNYLLEVFFQYKPL